MPNIAINDADKGISYIPFTEPVPKRTIGLFWRKTNPRKELMEQFSKHIFVAVNHAEK